MAFWDGQRLTASALNDMDSRTVPVYATTASRDAALPAPTEGRMCVVAGSLYTYTGGSWQVQGTRVVRKGAAQSVTSSTTLVDDTALSVALAPGTYAVQAIISATGDTAGDVKIAWSFSGTATAQDRSVVGPASGITAVHTATMRSQAAIALTTAVDYGTATGSTSRIVEDLHIVVTAAGTLRLQWAQATSSATATQVMTGSRLLVTRVSS